MSPSDFLGFYCMHLKCKHNGLWVIVSIATQLVLTSRYLFCQLSDWHNDCLVWLHITILISQALIGSDPSGQQEARAYGCLP